MQPAVIFQLIIYLISPQNVRVRVNFGARLFLYSEGSKHRAAADMWSDSLEDIRRAFEELPFAFDADVFTEELLDGPVLSKPSPPKPAPLTIPKDEGKGAQSLNETVHS